MVAIQATEYPELREYLIGDLHLLASPKDLKSLSIRRKRNPDLNRLLKDFADPKKRDVMLAQAWAEFDAQCEYRYKNKSSPYFAGYGTRGMGKSEVMTALAERCRDHFEKYYGMRPLIGFGRNPSDLNDLLAKATIRGKVAVLIGDEAESEVGIGSATDERALLENLETVRLLQHTVIRCTNRFRRLLQFSYYCDFVFEVIFSDRLNRVNYCIMYIVDEEIGLEDPRVPVGIINVPLHNNESLRSIYEEMKSKEQREFTSSGGRRSRIRAKLESPIEKVVKHIQDEHISVGRGCEISKPRALLRILLLHVDQGDKWTGDEQEVICEEAYARLTKQKNPPGGPSPDPVKTPAYTGSTEDLRAAVIARLIERGNDPLKVRAFEIYVTRKISQDNVSLLLKDEAVTASQATVNDWVQDIAGTDEYFDRTELGFSFEDVYSTRLTKQGVRHIKGGENTPRPDIIILNDDNTFREVRSLKCFVQRRPTYTITRDKIGARELQCAQENHIPVYLVFYDIWHNIQHEPVLITESNTYNFGS